MHLIFQKTSLSNLINCTQIKEHVKIDNLCFFMDIINKNINLYTFPLAVKFLEELLYDPRNFMTIYIIPWKFYNFFIGIYEFISVKEEENRKICKEYIEIIENLSFKNFFNSLDLCIELRERDVDATDREALNKIIVFLFERKHEKLKFSNYSDTHNINAFYKEAGSRYYFIGHSKEYIAIFNMYFLKKSIKDIDTIINDMLQISLSFYKDFRNLTEITAFKVLVAAKSVGTIGFPHRSSFKPQHSWNEITEKIQNIFIFDKNNTRTTNVYEIIKNFIVDFVVAVSRCRCQNKITNLQLENLIKYITDSNAKLKSIKQLSFEISNFDEWILTLEIGNHIQYLFLLPREHSKESEGLVIAFSSVFYSYLQTIYNIFKENLPYEQSALIAFYFVGNLFKNSEFKATSFHEKIILCFNKLYPNYFATNCEKYRMDIMCINAIFHQLLFLLNLTFSKVSDHESLCLPILSNDQLVQPEFYRIEIYCKESITPKVSNIHYDFFWESKFLELLMGLLKKYPGIYKCFFCACKRRLELTSDFDDSTLKLCYTLLHKISIEISFGQDIFMECDRVLALHVKNAVNLENFQILCDIVKVFIKWVKSQGSSTKKLASYMAVVEKKRETRWRYCF